MHKRFIALTLGAVVAASALMANTAVAQDKIRIATNVPYKPMEYTTPDGSLTGFDIELGNALCAEAGLDCSWVQQSWNGIIPGLMARKYDAIMSSMTITDQRKRVLRFSAPYIVVPSGWFVPVDTDLADFDGDDLAGKRIAVQRGTVQDQYVTDKFGDSATIKRYANADDIAVDMSAGRLDAAFLDFPTGQSTLLDESDAYKHAGPVLTEPKKYFGTGFGIAFRRNQKDLAARFNKALAVVKDNGTYQTIYEKYFGKTGESKQAE